MESIDNLISNILEKIYFLDNGHAEESQWLLSSKNFINYKCYYIDLLFLRLKLHTSPVQFCNSGDLTEIQTGLLPWVSAGCRLDYSYGKLFRAPGTISNVGLGFHTPISNSQNTNSMSKNSTHFWHYLSGHSIGFHSWSLKSGETALLPHFSCALPIHMSLASPHCDQGFWMRGCKDPLQRGSMLLLVLLNWLAINERFPQPPPQLQLIC